MSSRLPVLSRALRGAVVVGSVGYIALYLAIALLRMSYPFELEWMEGSLVDHVQRVVSGQRIYGPPSLGFVPFLYPPLYYYVAAGMTLVLGGGLLPLRLVSFLSSVGLFAVIFALVRRETGSRFAAVLAVGLFAATFRIGGAWLDLARVDSLFLLLLCASIYLVRFGRTHRMLAAAGCVLALSALTKQTALAVAPALIIYVMVVDWRKGLAFVAGLGVTLGGVTLGLDLLQGGWYGFYVFGLPAGIQDVGGIDLDFWTVDLLRPMAPACALSLAALAFTARTFRGRADLFYPLVGGVLLLASWSTRAHLGAYDNVLLPAYLALAILAALAVHAVQRTRTHTWAVPVYALCLLQFALLRYSPRAQLPTANDLALGRELIERIEESPGEVFLPHHSHISTLAGRRSFAHWMAIFDVGRAGDPDTNQRLTDLIQRAIRNQRFTLIILDEESPWLEPALAASYVRVGAVFDRDGFWPVTGARTRPESIYVPR